MRKVLCCILSILLITSMFSLQGAAAEQSENAIYFEDGSYMVILIQETQTRAVGMKTGTKTYSYYSNSGNLEWQAVLSGSFTYTGSSAACSASDCSVTISNSSWYVVSKSVGKSGSSATCELTMGLKFLGITTDKETVNMKLSCDANGNLS